MAADTDRKKNAWRLSAAFPSGNSRFFHARSVRSVLILRPTTEGVEAVRSARYETPIRGNEMTTRETEPAAATLLALLIARSKAPQNRPAKKKLANAKRRFLR
jgi:hypothetical protein